MPWDAKSFAPHNHSLSPSQAVGAAKIANGVLKSTGNEGLAIATANARAKGKKPDINTHHALSIGGAHHMLKAGHINKAQHGHIVKSAKAGLASGKKAKPMPFGSLAPAVPDQDAQ